MEIVPVTPERIPELAVLFETHGATRGCWCMAFCMSSRKEHDIGHRGGNRVRFEKMAETADPPMGLLLARLHGEPVGWCAMGPRSRYPVATGSRTQIMKDRDPSEDDNVWLVPCFFVRVGYRKAGVTYALLHRAIELAREYGAPAVEGWPRAGTSRQQNDMYLGRERLFEAAGFRCVARPTPQRAVMRLELD